jgi:AcrR family transcriptional regulator
MAEVQSTTPEAQSSTGPGDRRSRRGAAFIKRPRRGPGSYDRRLSAEERRDEQRRTLIDAAAHVFALDGYANASVASILEASGLSRGTFYRHFKDLREVFLAVQENAAEVLQEKLEAAFASKSEPAEKLRACVTAYLALCAENGDLSRVFHREALVSGKEYAELRQSKLEDIQGLFKQGLAQAVASGLIPAMPAELTIYAIMVAIEGVALRYLEEYREHELTEAIEPLVRVAFRSFS